MPYVMKTITAGKVVEVEKHYSARYGKRCGRSAKREPTREQQQEINRRNAETHLRRLINANFGAGDWHLVLGYRREYTRSPEEAKQDLSRFLRKYRVWCKENGVPVRYITVTEYERKRVHHHLVIPAIPLKVLYELWVFGRPHITPLDRTGDYGQLASYLIKETERTFQQPNAATRKRWTQSKGLNQPIVKHTVIHADKWREQPKAKRGYYILKNSIVSGIHDVTGMPYQRYIMIEVGNSRPSG